MFMYHEMSRNPIAFMAELTDAKEAIARFEKFEDVKPNKALKPRAALKTIVDQPEYIVSTARYLKMTNHRALAGKSRAQAASVPGCRRQLAATLMGKEH